ncbi:hypothetical protein bcere0007_53490 [Bacillus mycoides]|uniref:hypothetical protein n=1 Tax=Bacillus mycoides TaxID=1405 RepID=UPI0001A02E69|nr:hypothetical protein [Bacillus mycoides]EEK70202.1 hypothetical protein bcere0007_53490 [Bacillus mycoides]
MEVIAQTFKLSEQALLHVLKSLTKLLENKEQLPENYILDENTKVSKRKINELIKKNDKNGGVIPLNKNWFWCKNFEVYENGLSNLDMLIVLLYKRCVISMEKENNLNSYEF